MLHVLAEDILFDEICEVRVLAEYYLDSYPCVCVKSDGVDYEVGGTRVRGVCNVILVTIL